MNGVIAIILDKQLLFFQGNCYK